MFLSLGLWSSPTLMAQPGYTSHAPILISGNSGFTAPNGVTSGSGTVLDPYIIQGWDINASTAHGIRISNSNVYFTIRNVYIHSGRAFNNVGVVLDHLVNGRIQDSSMTQNYEAIWLNYSTHVEVSNNYMFRNYIGANFGGGALEVTATNDTIIANNDITNNTRSNIIVYSSNNVNITGNTASWSAGLGSVGVFIITSTNMMIVNNTISNNENDGLQLQTSTGVHVYHNKFQANSGYDVNGGGNMWDNGYPSGGNIWIDPYFTGEDNCTGPNQNICTGPDGIVDTPYTLQSGQQDHYPLAVHDGAIISVQSPSRIFSGETALVNVTAENLGNVAEKHFTVTLSYGDTQIGSQTLADFASYRMIVLNFRWNTGTLLEKGVSPGSYTLTASVSIPMDTNSANNSKSTSTQVLAFPTTPLLIISGAGTLPIITGAIIAAGILTVWALSLVRKRNRTANTDAA